MCKHCREHNGGKVVWAALLGAAVGTVLGFLTAPASGEETRKKVKTTAEDLAKNSEQKVQEIKDKIEENAGSIKENLATKVEPIRQEVEKKLTPVLDKLEQFANEIETEEDTKSKKSSKA